MGNWRATRPTTLTPVAMEAMRHGIVAGLSRRQLLRRSLGLGIGLLLIEGAAGMVRFLWSATAVGFGGPVVAGTLDDLMTMPAVPGTSLREGAPAYVHQAKAYVQLIDPNQGMLEGASPLGDGAAVNVRALYQRCPHLGCKPNFCTRNALFECACHQSRYDRLGTKVDKWGPAPRSLDRFATSVTDGILTIDTSVITLGPLPIALGQPGLVPPTSPTGCI